MFNVSVIVWAECSTRYRQMQKITIHKRKMLLEFAKIDFLIDFYKEILP